LKRERWGSPLVQEKYREEKVCDMRHTYRVIIIIIMMMMMMMMIIIIINNCNWVVIRWQWLFYM